MITCSTCAIRGERICLHISADRGGLYRDDIECEMCQTGYIHQHEKEGA